MKDKRSTKSYKSHKRAINLTLPSCAWRCSSKLQKIQSWETLFQKLSKVHKYQYIQTNTIFVFFWFFLFFLLEKHLKQSKDKQTNKHSIKTTLTQAIIWTMHEIRRVKESLGIFFLPDGRLGGDPLFCMNFCPDG